MANVLDQNEVDALLMGVVKGEVETESDIPPEEQEVSLYDLTSQDKIIRGRMPTLEVINERFARLFRASLSSIFMKAVDIGVVSTDMMKFGEFIKSIPLPTSLNIFKMEPLRGFAIVVVESKLVFAMVDSLFGGTGDRHMKVEGRDFTPIEHNIIKKVVLSALKDLQEAWKPVYDVDIQYVRTEVNPQFAAIVPPSEVVIFIPIEVELEQVSGFINLCIPYSTVEPIREKLHAGFQSDYLEVDQQWIKRVRGQLYDASVRITGEMGRAKITGREVLKLKIGDIIQLDNSVNSGVRVKVEGITKFKGVPGQHSGNMGIKITEILE